MNFIFIFISSSDPNLLRKKAVIQKIKKRWPKQKEDFLKVGNLISLNGQFFFIFAFLFIVTYYTMCIISTLITGIWKSSEIRVMPGKHHYFRQCSLQIMPWVTIRNSNDNKNKIHKNEKKNDHLNQLGCNRYS